MRFEVVEPFEHLRVTYTGQGRAARRPARDGRSPEGVHREPLRRVHRRPIDYTRVSDMFGGEPEEAHEQPGRGVRQGPLRAARARASARSPSTARPTRSTATACATTPGARATGRRPGTTGGSPPTWAATSASWRHGSRAATATAPAAASSGTASGCTCATTWRSAPSGRATTPTTSASRRCCGPSDDDGSPLEWRVTGEVLNLIPLRNRREGLVTRISEGLTRWTLEDGRDRLRAVGVPRPDRRRPAGRPRRVSSARWFGRRVPAPQTGTRRLNTLGIRHPIRVGRSAVTNTLGGLVNSRQRDLLIRGVNHSSIQRRRRPIRRGDPRR